MAASALDRSHSAFVAFKEFSADIAIADALGLATHLSLGRNPWVGVYATCAMAQVHSSSPKASAMAVLALDRSHSACFYLF
jgi:hypothetical protein